MTILSQPVADSATRATAGLNERGQAVVVDTLILIAAYVVIGSWSAARWGGQKPGGFELKGMAAVVTIALTFLVAFLYYWLFEGTIGATLGKVVTGIRVRDAGGGAIGLGAAFTRTLCRLVDGIGVYLVGWIIALCSKRRQRLGDRLARTVVVREFAPRTRILAAIGSLAWIVVVALGVHAVRNGGASPTLGSNAPARADGGPHGVQRNASSQPAAPVVLTSDAALAAGSTLAVSNVVWSDQAGGPARSAEPYARGTTAYGTYELNGFAHAPDGHVDVGIRVTPVDPDGLAVLAPMVSDVRSASASSGPIHGRFEVQVPPFAPAGTYTMRIAVHDNIGGGEAQFTPTFAITGPPLAPAGAFEVRDFTFTNAQGGDAGARPVYHAGETVSFAAKFSGVQFRHDSASVNVGLALVDPKGTAVMSKDEWGGITDGPLYHPSTFFVPVSSNLTLPSPVAPGTYALRFTVTDKIAPATLTYDAHFDVR